MTKEKMYGWRGTVLRVDLTREKITKQPLDKEVAAKFIGGRGLNIKVLFDEVKPGIDPLSPENILCFSSGPLTGTSVSLSSRIEVSTLSPYSGILGDGNSGGDFPAFLRLAGYDQLIITGRANSPKYLWLNDGSPELRNASDLWGKTTWESTDILREELGKDIKVASIGQAGENLVRFACTVFDRHCTAARGSGAVCGSKNLKAIAVRGTGKVELAKPDEFEKLAREDREYFLTDKFQREIHKYGTHLGVIRWGPDYRYFKKSLGPEDIPDGLKPEGWKKYELGRYGCHGCVVACKDVFRIPEGKYKGEIGKSLEYETIFCTGINCGILDPLAIMEMGNLADKYGMDTIPLGNTIAFAKELYNKGIITKEDTGGLSLDWENVDDQIELLHQTALREGFGNLIAEGMYSFAKIIGRGAMDYCYHVKGLSRGPPNYPVGVFTLAHATSTRGADHLRGRSWAFGENDPHLFPEWVKKGLVPTDPVPALIVSENAVTLTDMIGRCKGSVNNWPSAVPLVFKYPLWDGLVKLLTAETGIEYDAAKIVEAAERVYTLERALLIRQGITRKHDRLVTWPNRKGTPEEKQDLEEHAKMLMEYYKMRGWDSENGVPTRQTLERLGLKYVADEIEAHGPYPEWDGPPLWPLNKYPHGGTRA